MYSPTLSEQMCSLGEINNPTMMTRLQQELKSALPTPYLHQQVVILQGSVVSLHESWRRSRGLWTGMQARNEMVKADELSF